MKCPLHPVFKAVPRCVITFWLTVAPLSAVAVSQARTDDPIAVPSSSLQSSAMRLTLATAVAMGLQHNRHLLLARDAVRDGAEQKRIAESHLYPVLKNQSGALYITDLEGIRIPAGALAANTPIGPLPPANIVVGQGAQSTYTSGTELVQPLTQLFRIHSGVLAADAGLRMANIQSRDADADIVLQIHQLYYGILIEKTRGEAAQAALDAAMLSDQEIRRSFEQGSLLQDAELGSKTDVLDKQQAVLISRLNRADLVLRLDDMVGLPLETRLALDSEAAGVLSALPTREEAMLLALGRSPEVLIARQGLAKAKAGVTAARTAYIPDVTALARYSYQSGLPFLPHNFGTFGGTVTYNLFDGGAREANLRDARIRLTMAETQLAQTEDDARIEISAAYDKVEQLEHLLSVATQGLAFREESLRIQQKRAGADAELASGVSASVAAVASARVNVLNAQLGRIVARGNIKRLLGEKVE